MLNALEDQLLSETNELVFQWHCAAAQVTGWDEKEALFDYHSGQAKHAYNVIGKNLLPWYKQWKVEERSVADLWKAFKAAEKDPVYGAHLKKRKAELISGLEKEHTDAEDYKRRLLAAEREREQREVDIRKRKDKRNARLRQ